MSSAAARRTTPEPDLLARLWWAGLLRGSTALALGGYIASQTPSSSAAVARTSAAYWVVDGLVTMWASASIATLTLNRLVLLLRGCLAVGAGLVIFGLPLGDVFGRWHPGQLLILLSTATLLLAVIALQIVAGAFDVHICLAIRRRIPGEWSVALGAALSVVLGVIVAATLAAPPALLGRTLAPSAMAAGFGILTRTARLRADRESSSLPAYSNKG